MDKKRLVLLVVASFFLLLSVITYIFLSDNAGEIYDLRVTNVEANAATITWRTRSKFPSAVVVSNTNSFVPYLNDVRTFRDDRNPDDKSAYYTHHVTISDLDPETKYHFKVRGQLRLIPNETDEFTTTELAEAVTTPKPIYGSLVAPEGITEDASEGIVYYYIEDIDLEDGETQLYSTLLGEDATFAGDINGWEDEDSKLVIQAVTDIGTGVQRTTLADGYEPLPEIQLSEIDLAELPQTGDPYCDQSYAENGGWNFGPTLGNNEWCTHCRKDCGGFQTECIQQAGGEAAYNNLCSPLDANGNSTGANETGNTSGGSTGNNGGSTGSSSICESSTCKPGGSWNFGSECSAGWIQCCNANCGGFKDSGLCAQNAAKVNQNYNGSSCTPNSGGSNPPAATQPPTSGGTTDPNTGLTPADCQINGNWNFGAQFSGPNWCGCCASDFIPDELKTACAQQAQQAGYTYTKNPAIGQCIQTATGSTPIDPNLDSSDADSIGVTINSPFQFTSDHKIVVQHEGNETVADTRGDIVANEEIVVAQQKTKVKKTSSTLLTSINNNQKHLNLVGFEQRFAQENPDANRYQVVNNRTNQVYCDLPLTELKDVGGNIRRLDIVASSCNPAQNSTPQPTLPPQAPSIGKYICPVATGPALCTSGPYNSFSHRCSSIRESAYPNALPVDFRNLGSSVIAAESGVVESCKSHYYQSKHTGDSCIVNSLKSRGGSGIKYRYMHVNFSVSQGDWVQTGQKLGTLFPLNNIAEGWGTHLHFEGYDASGTSIDARLLAIELGCPNMASCTYSGETDTCGADVRQLSQGDIRYRLNSINPGIATATGTTEQNVPVTNKVFGQMLSNSIMAKTALNSVTATETTEDAVLGASDDQHTHTPLGEIDEREPSREAAVTSLNKGVHKLEFGDTDNTQRIVIAQEDYTQVKYFLDKNENGVKESGEQELDPTEIIATAERLNDLSKYQLKAGLNLIAIQIVEDNWANAEEFFDYLTNSRGIAINQISYLDNNRWQTFAKDSSGKVYGRNFDMQVDRGYFINVAEPSRDDIFELILIGDEIKLQDELSLKRGWNLISISDNSKFPTAEDMFNYCEERSLNCDYVSRYLNFSFESYIKQGEDFFGDNFILEPLTAYFIHVAAPETEANMRGLLPIAVLPVGKERETEA